MSIWTLAVDTSTIVTAGLARDGQAVASRAVGDNHSHVELLTPTVESMLADAGITMGDIEHIGMGVGPGPFTGLRVGMVTAITWGVVGHLPVKGVCSLDVMAAQWAENGAPDDFVIASDARRKELYWARYQGGQRIGEVQVSAPERLPDLPTGGPGVDVYAALLAGQRPHGAPTGIDAGFIAAHLDELDDAGHEPMYLRKPDAELPSARKSALAGGRHRVRAPRTISR